MTTPKYLTDTYLEEFTAKITKVIEMDDSVAVYCDDTIFYPQGGGQPCDLGIIVIDGCTYQVHHTETTEDGIAHVLESHPLLLTCTGKLCIQRIDIQRRLFNAKSHTAGHLISHLFEELDSNLSPAKGHHYPDDAYIELIESERTNDTFSVALINEQIDALVDKTPRPIQSIELDLAEVQSLRPLLSKFIPQSTHIRMIAIDGFTPVPCGGTHVSSTSELKGLRVTRIKRKKDRIKVSYLIN
ncbi:alanyl-tRNA editing protein [Photobacterium halotolerans]|uniref:alanyl-tRNA editing protein n=1 Tax=Photobacterium halotolerans TaxID=265726 RepID=UPI0004872227|nr:alanyl-tRNA editing protein [Photobacterium halotolerans]